MQDQERTNVLAALQLAETKKRPSLETMFEDVYDVKTPHLIVRFVYLSTYSFDVDTYLLVMYQEQEREMLDHVAKYPDYYYVEEH